VYSGLMEKQIWPQSPAKFARMRTLQRVFSSGEVTIYHVKGAPT
jgi:hypothetical protein